MPRTRLLALDDAPTLGRLLRSNREFLAPWDPVRPEAYYTDDGQGKVVRDALASHAAGTSLPHVILDEAGAVVGRITLNGIVLGPFLSCSVGYWVNAADNGRGLAGAALADIKRVAFDELGLHRIQAETLAHNTASQRVLERNGFLPIGLAPEFLNIAGRWQDHLLFQVLNPKARSPSWT